MLLSFVHSSLVLPDFDVTAINEVDSYVDIAGIVVVEDLVFYFIDDYGPSFQNYWWNDV